MVWFRKQKTAESHESESQGVTFTVNTGDTPLIMKYETRARETWEIVEPTKTPFPPDNYDACRYAIGVLVSANSISAEKAARHNRVTCGMNPLGQRVFVVEIEAR